MTSPVNTSTSKRGFASMDPQRQREIASLGGKTAHQNGTAHEFTSAQGKAAAAKRTANMAKRKTLTLATKSNPFPQGGPAE